jgi:hypothetical protein
MKKILLYSLVVLIGLAAISVIFFTVRQALANAQIEHEWQVVPASIPNLKTTSRLEIMSLALRPKTWIHYQQVIKKHILPGLGDLFLEELQPDQIHAFYQLKRREGTGNRTLMLINCILHHTRVWSFPGQRQPQAGAV